MNYAIMLAGGTGSRTSTDIPKQYVRAEGHMMITYALAPLLSCARICKIYIVCEDLYKEGILSDIQAAGLKADKIAGYTGPGETRQLSIYKGLEAVLKDNIVGDDDAVIIHDAARPFLTSELVDRCFDALPGHSGVMPVLPMKDTVYMSKTGESITALLDRNTIYAGQAPELFILKKYFAANKALLPEKIKYINGASEPAVLYGMDIAMISGDEHNIKITTDADIEGFINIKGKEL